MHIKTFRAKTMPQALDLVRRELGPEAMVLHTRELNAGLLGRMLRGRAYEIAATPPPSNPAARHKHVRPLEQDAASDEGPTEASPSSSVRAGLERGIDLSSRPADARSVPPSGGDARHFDRPKGREHRHADAQLAELHSLIEQLRTRAEAATEHRLPSTLAALRRELLEADFEEPIARELIEAVQRDPAAAQGDLRAARARLARTLETQFRVAGPIHAPTGSGRVVALVGPTGVGKTTTIAKLAANYRLREERRVGLITVDTYRIAAVEQLRTYAQIIDLPMEVVSTPAEMRQAVRSMRDFDLVLMDTAGRSPRDEVRIRELAAMLAEAQPDEVHLVLSAATGGKGLAAAAERFAPVGVTALVITKLDEAAGLGQLLTLARRCELPFSYLTTGQNVPDDIAVADSAQLARSILNLT